MASNVLTVVNGLYSPSFHRVGGVLRASTVGDERGGGGSRGNTEGRRKQRLTHAVRWVEELRIDAERKGSEVWRGTIICVAVCG